MTAGRETSERRSTVCAGAAAYIAVWWYAHGVSLSVVGVFDVVGVVGVCAVAVIAISYSDAPSMLLCVRIDQRRRYWVYTIVHVVCYLCLFCPSTTYGEISWIPSEKAYF